MSTGKVVHTSVQLSANVDKMLVANQGTVFEYDICPDWIGEHVALVGEPAYGRKKAVIKAVCEGSLAKCRLELPKSASDEDRTMGQKPVARMIEDAVVRMYSPCNMDDLVRHAPPLTPVGRARDANPGFTPAQTVAAAFVEHDRFAKALQSELSEFVLAEFAKQETP